MDSSQQALIRRLDRCIREIEANSRTGAETAISWGVLGLQKVLPKVSVGSLVELFSARQGAGVWTLALILARQACGERKMLVIADEERRFYPPAAARMGIDLCRTVVIRPKKVSGTFLASLVQALRCPAVGAVLGWFDRLPPVDFRRLQLAAESGGGLGLVLRPAAALRTPSFAAARLLVAPVASGEESLRRIRIEAVRVRGGKSGQSVVLEVDDETGDVRVPAVLAAAAPVARAARSSG